MGHLHIKVNIILVKNSHNKGHFSGPDNVHMYIILGCKTCEIGRKGYVFDHFYRDWLEHNGQFKKEHEKNVYLGSVCPSEKCVF